MILVNKVPCGLNYFPDGTLALRGEPVQGHVDIEWVFERNEELPALYFLTRHFREGGASSIDLYLPYIPNARMDRVKHSDEVFTLKYFSELINLMHFEHVHVRDAHSNVAPALIDRVVCMDIKRPLENLAARLLGEGDIIFYPDEGACKRYDGLLDIPYAFGVKKREWRTGEIQSLEVEGTIPQEPFNALIVDDISSFGLTFLHAAQKLKELGANKIWLYVTHCEANILRGCLKGSGLIEKVFTTDSIFREYSDFVEILR